MSALDDAWNNLVAGTAPPPSNPHLRKMVLVHARNRAAHPEEAERLAALQVLRRIGGPDAMTVATAFSSDVSLDVRRRLLQLALEAADDGWGVLRKLAGDPDPHLSIDSIRRLTEVGDRSATTRMRGLLNARHAMVRGRAAVFLGEYGGPSLVPLLRRSLKEPDEAARSAVAWAMAKLEGHTDDPPPDTGETWPGLALLGATGPPDAPAPDEPPPGHDPSAGHEDPAPATPEDKEAVPHVVDPPTSDASAPSESEPVATPAPVTPTPEEPAKPPVGAPPTEADGGVLGLLRELAVHPDRREDLVARLRAADERELSEAFRGRKAGQHPDLCVGAAIAAAELGNGRWLAPVRRLSADPEARVRAAVAGAIGALCTPASYRQLEDLVRDPEPAVQIAALHALAIGARTLNYQAQASRLVAGLPETKDGAVNSARATALAALDAA